MADRSGGFCLALRLTGVTRAFGDVLAVDGVSMAVEQGSIFGFLGPNGAGKTTTIRMILGLLLADAGSITWQGQPLTEATRLRFGYLPEERGLYPRMRVRDQMIYLGRLKGMGAAAAQQATTQWLGRLGLAEYAARKTDPLSKGNQQKLQFAAALMHRPELVILDEPFSGLDPINTQVLKEALLELNRQGTTVLFSSHQMEAVEALCRDVALIAQGRLLLAGNLREIKRQSRQRVARLRLEGDRGFLRAFPQVRVQAEHPEYTELTWQGDLDPQTVLQAALAAGRVERWELGEPSLTDIYVRKVGEAG